MSDDTVGLERQLFLEQEISHGLLRRAKKAERLLKDAKCPNKCENGYVDVVYDDNLHMDQFASSECQWCAERQTIIGRKS